MPSASYIVLCTQRDGDCGVHGMSEGILEEVCICPVKDASIVGIEWEFDDLLVVRAGNGDSGGESDFYRGVHSG